jgi:hypothetical protein
VVTNNIHIFYWTTFDCSGNIFPYLWQFN